MSAVLLNAILFELLAAASPPAAPATLRGTWQGTIGALPISACFDERDWSTTGGYFYRSRLRYIPLDQDQHQKLNFTEGSGSNKGAPHWSLQQPIGAVIAGRWTQGDRSLPIRLQRVALPKQDESACGSLAFHQPRLAGVHNVTAHFKKKGVGFRRISVDLLGRFQYSGQSTVQLDGDGPAIRKINAALYESFAAPRPAWLDCILGALDWGQGEGDFEETYEPHLITPRWLSVSHSVGYYCGGAHPDAVNDNLLFDRRTGSKVDLLDWFAPVAVKREGTGDELMKTLTHPFAAFVSDNAKGAEEDCRDMILEADFWDLELTAEAIRFTPSLPHVAFGCTETYTVPHARLERYLNAVGRAEIARLHT